jgi:hypothetical protein
MVPIPVVADVPTPQPGLGFGEYVTALSDAVVGGEPPQFTIGLYGAWGTGKSSLLHALAVRLEQRGSVTPVLFDAWRYERSEHIVVPLLHAIRDSLADAGKRDIAAQVERALRSLVFSLKFSVAGVGWDGRAMKQNWDEFDLSPLDGAFAQPFAQLQEISRKLGDHRVAVLIDDLDRCSPAKVVGLLEAINVVMDIQGFIFVLAIDYDVLVDAVGREHPHVSGHDFIEKIVQLPFRVPPLAERDPRLLAEVVPGWTRLAARLPRSASLNRAMHDIAVLGLRSNPRQIKRLVNSLLVILRIVELRKLHVNQMMLAAMIGLQLRWPTEHRAFQNAVRMNDEAPLDTLLKAEDPELQRYAGRFFDASELTIEDLRQLLQLTAVVVAEPGAGGAARDPDEPQTLDAFVRRLDARGLVESKAAGGELRVFRRPKRPNHRVTISDSTVQYERRMGRNWEAWHTFGVRPHDLAQALKAVDDPIRYDKA